MFSNIVNIIESIMIIIASAVAIYGISSWRREMRGKKEYDLAENVLALFYEARDKIAIIRSPLGSSDEGKSRKPAENESPEDKKAFDQAYVTYERFQIHHETFNRLQSLRYRFMALFGQEKSKPFNDLNKIVSDIQIASSMLGFYWSRLWRRSIPMSGRQYEKFEKRITESESTLWAGGLPDPISERVEKVIEEIEVICNKILRKNKYF